MAATDISDISVLLTLDSQITQGLNKARSEIDKFSNTKIKSPELQIGDRNAKSFISGLTDSLKSLKLPSFDLKSVSSGIGSALSSVGSQISGLAGSFSGIASSASSAFTSIITSAGAAGVAIGGVALAITSVLLPALAGIGPAAKLEQAEVGFAAILGGADKAALAIKQLNDLASTTPFAFQNIADASKTLLGFGFDANNVFNNQEGILKRLVDISAVFGSDLKGLSVVVGQVFAQGALYAEDFNQLVNQAPGLIQELSKNLGISAGQVKKLGSEGKIGFKELNDAIKSITSEGGAAFNGAIAQSKTFSGLISTAKDNITLLFADIAKESGIFDAVKDGVKFFIDYITNNKDSIIAFFKDVKVVLEVIGDTLRAIAVFTVKNFKIITNVITLDFKNLAKNIGDVFKTASKIFSIDSKSVQKNIATSFGGTASAAEKAGKDIGNALNNGLKSKIKDIDFTSFFNKIGSGTKNASFSVRELEGFLKRLNIELEAGKSVVTNLEKKYKDLQDRFKELTQDTPLQGQSEFENQIKSIDDALNILKLEKINIQLDVAGGIASPQQVQQLEQINAEIDNQNLLREKAQIQFDQTIAKYKEELKTVGEVKKEEQDFNKVLAESISVYDELKKAQTDLNNAREQVDLKQFQFDELNTIVQRAKDFGYEAGISIPTQLISGFKDKADLLKFQLETGIGKPFEDVKEAINQSNSELVDQFGKDVNTLISQSERLKDELALAKKAASDTKSSIGGGIDSGFANADFGDTGFIGPVLPTGYEKFRLDVMSVFDSLAKELKNFYDTTAGLFSSIFDLASNTFVNIGQLFSGDLSLSGFFRNEFISIENSARQFFAAFGADFDLIVKGLADIFTEFTVNLAIQFLKLRNDVASKVVEIVNLFSTIRSSIADKIGDFTKPFRDGIENIKQIFNDFVNFDLAEIALKIREKISTSFDIFKRNSPSIADRINELVDFYGNATGKIEQFKPYDTTSGLDLANVGSTNNNSTFNISVNGNINSNIDAQRLGENIGIGLSKFYGVGIK